jgi:hypothetical protein
MSSDFTPFGRSIDTPVTSFSITSGEDIFQDEIPLLFPPQERKIHAIPGSHLAAPSQVEGPKERKGRVG